MFLLAASFRQWSPNAFAVARLIWFFSFSLLAASPFWITSFKDAAAKAVPDNATAAMAAVSAMRIFMVPFLRYSDASLTSVPILPCCRRPYNLGQVVVRG